MNGLFRLALEASIRAAVVASCVGVILVLARVRSGAVRHAAWTAVLCAMFLMPVLPHLTPEIRVPVASPPIFWEADSVSALPAIPVRVLAESSATPVQAPAEPNLTPAPTPRGALWPWAALAVYFAGVLILLARLAVGWRCARLLARTAEPVAAPLAEPGVPIGRCRRAARHRGPEAPSPSSALLDHMVPRETVRRAGPRSGTRAAPRCVGRACSPPESLSVLVPSVSPGGWSGNSRSRLSKPATKPRSAPWGKAANTRMSCWKWLKRCTATEAVSHGRALGWMAPERWSAASTAFCAATWRAVPHAAAKPPWP